MYGNILQNNAIGDGSMIDMVEEYIEYDISPLTPALNEFSKYVQQALSSVNQDKLNDRLILEATIYGSLIQTLDKHGLRTFGLATAIRKYYSYIVVEVSITDPEPKKIREIKIPIHQYLPTAKAGSSTTPLRKGTLTLPPESPRPE